MKNINLTLSLLIISGSIAVAQNDNASLIKVGSKAPAFVCKTIDGKAFDINQSKEK